MTWRKNQLVETKKKKSSKQSSSFEEPSCMLRSKAGSNSRIQFASNESEFVPRNLDLGPRICSGLNDILCTLEMNLPSLTALLPATTDLHGYERAKYLYHYIQVTSQKLQFKSGKFNLFFLLNMAILYHFFSKKIFEGLTIPFLDCQVMKILPEN